MQPVSVPSATVVDATKELIEPKPSANLPLSEVVATTPSAVLASHQFIVVSCYTRFDNLAHGPRGTEAVRSLYTYTINQEDGELVLLSVTKDESVMNPAFSRFHPRRNILYTCTESVAEDGEIVSWAVDPSGRLTKVGSQSARGTSTCYLTLDKECQNMLAVNYWNATIGVFGLEQETGIVGPARSLFDPNHGRPMKARADKHVNHSVNNKSAQKERQADPHSHAVILDPYFGRLAFVPDLGMDLIRQFRYNAEKGILEAAGAIKSGPDGRTALGPRYIEFHPRLPFAYVVNELSSEVSVFSFDLNAAKALLDESCDLKNAKPTFKLIQTVRTIPDGFPGDLNTCGRITVHKSGNFVLVSNRGHNSITVFRVHHEIDSQGLLSVVAAQHTRGATPRHFAFDTSGQWLITANQDSDKIGVFRFNIATGHLEFTGNEYSVPSPNFVCAFQPHTQAQISSESGRFASIESGSVPASRL